MKHSLSTMFVGIAVATFATTAVAYSTLGTPEIKPGAHPMDCTKAKDQARCVSLNKDIEACRGKVDDEWRLCMRRPLPAAKFAPPKLRDCDNAHNKKRCEAHNAALEACKDKNTRFEHRKCMESMRTEAAQN